MLRSLTFCLASGIEKIPDETNIIPLIIDYDKDNGDKRRTIDLLDTYTAIRNKAYEGVELKAGDRNFFHPVIRHLSDVATLDGRADVGVRPSYEFTFGLDDKTTAGTFADYIDYTNMIGDTYLTKDLLSSLYNDELQDSPNTELNLELSMGFKGNPNIGSIVFEELKNDAEFKRFCNTFDATHDRVFIISSIFGGTGSSGFPRIVDAIHYAGIAGFNQAMVGGCIVMPYFKVNTPEGGAINSNIFNSKQKAALSYYAQPDQNGKSIYDKLTTAYFIGDDEATNLPYSEGRDTQKNDAHIVEFLSALSVLDFICKDKATLELEAVRYREYGLPKNINDGEKFNFTNFDADDYEDYLQFLLQWDSLSSTTRTMWQTTQYRRRRPIIRRSDSVRRWEAECTSILKILSTTSIAGSTRWRARGTGSSRSYTDRAMKTHRRLSPMISMSMLWATRLLRAECSAGAPSTRTFPLTVMRCLRRYPIHGTTMSRNCLRHTMRHLARCMNCLVKSKRKSNYG